MSHARDLYDAVKDLRAEFEQISHVASIDKHDRSTGSVVVKRPGHMRWEYTEPEPRVILMSDGKLEMYDPGEKQLQIAPMDSNAISPTAMSFLLGKSDLNEVFELDGPPEEKEGVLRLRLKPRGKDAASFEYLELALDAKTYLLHESVVVDLFANRTRIVFRQVRENVGVTEEDFSLTVPNDTDVIDLR